MEEFLLQRIVIMQQFLFAVSSLAEPIMVVDFLYFLALLHLSLPVVFSSVLLIESEVDCIMIVKLIVILLLLIYYLQETLQMRTVTVVVEDLKTTEV